jgi:hypothetical protein
MKTTARKAAASRVLLLFPLAVVAGTTCRAQGKNPCEVITKAEAEAVVGAPLQPPNLSPKKTLCRYEEQGYGVDASKKKQVTIGIWQTATPDPQVINNRRQAIRQDTSLVPVVDKDVPDLADAAIWVWAGGYFGALYAFKGGTLEVAVKISGVPEAAALAAAKKFVARALGGTGKSGYAYAGTATLDERTPYNVPGILRPLYLGTFDPIADDENTRNYVISLVQAFNGSCSKVPEIFAVMDYGFYYERKALRGTMQGAMQNDLDKGFAQAIEAIRRSHPHILIEGREDAELFLAANGKKNECLTAPVKRLYDNIARLALQRRDMPPDVDDDYHFARMLSPAAQKKIGFDPETSGRSPRQQELIDIKKACLEFTKGAAFPQEMEGFCRCHVDAAVQAKLPQSDLDLLKAHFNNDTLEQLSKRNALYDKRKKACYH